MASKTLDRMVEDPNCPIEDYDDLRREGDGYVVYLYKTYQWESCDDATVRGFDTIAEIREHLKAVVARDEPHPDVKGPS